MLKVMPKEGQFVAVWTNANGIWSTTLKWEDNQLKNYNMDEDCWDYECDHGFTDRFFKSVDAVFINTMPTDESQFEVVAYTSSNALSDVYCGQTSVMGPQGSVGDVLLYIKR